MGYKIDYKKLIKLRNKLDELLNEMETDAKNLTILSEYMYDSCSINCKAARSVKAYVKDVHISAVSPYILNAIDVVRTITTEYFYEMYEIDNGEDSVIQEEHLENLEGKLYGLKNKACEILFELEKYAEAISDIMDVTTKNAEELELYFDEQKLIVTKLKKEFELYESEKLEEAKAAQQVINGFYTKVSNYGNDNLDITQYDGEYYIEPLPTEGLPEVEQLYDELGYNDEENVIDTLGEVGGIILNEVASNGIDNEIKSLRQQIEESEAAKKWGVLQDGTNQGVRHFFDYWEKYPERIPSLEQRLGVPQGYFDKSLDGFNNFTTQALRVIEEASKKGNVKNINGKIIYYVDGVNKPKKGVVVIVRDGKIQSMMPSDYNTFLKMK